MRALIKIRNAINEIETKKFTMGYSPRNIKRSTVGNSSRTDKKNVDIKRNHIADNSSD